MTFAAPAATKPEDIERLIHERYPDLEAVFKPVPELWAILMWSVGGANLSRTQIQAAMQNTSWYRGQSEAQRNWFVLQATDPTEAAKRHEQAAHDVWLAAQRMGANFDWNQVTYVARLWMMNGWTTAEMNDQLIAYTSKLPESKRDPGAFGAAITKARQIADEYAVPVTDAELQQYAKRTLMSGTRGDTPGFDEASIRNVFADRAKALYPWLGNQLDEGVTIKDWAEPYIALAARELEISPSSVSLKDPMWQAILKPRRDDEKGPQRSQTLSEWQDRIRTEEKYGFDKTTGAQLIAAGLADGLARTFGNAA